MYKTDKEATCDLWNKHENQAVKSDAILLVSGLEFYFYSNGPGVDWQIMQ